jgi:hypothetical protein
MTNVIDEHVPPIGPGDKLSREECLRRWEAHPPEHERFVAHLAARRAANNPNDANG